MNSIRRLMVWRVDRWTLAGNQSDARAVEENRLDGSEEPVNMVHV